MFACSAELWVEVHTHFLALDHYEKYMHILGMKMKEIVVLNNGFTEVNMFYSNSKLTTIYPCLISPAWLKLCNTIQ